mmetsp:Transcript_10668/g.17607  ORF Transcript_10668/g.17607 Transcript_10668/m.17607 type:complete len:239 (+) Transcript_10668:79-795(+)
MRISNIIVAAALLLSSEVCAAQVVEETTIAHRRRNVKIYSSSSIRREELNTGVVDPFLGLPDERAERHLEGSMSVPIASMSGSFSLPTTTVAPAATTTEPAFCIEVYEPVCGEDGSTYSNACKAGLANVAVAYEGECKAPTTTSAPEPESTSTTTGATTTILPVAPDTVDVTTTAATTYVLPMPDDELTPSPTPFPVESMGVSFQAPDGAPSSAMVMGQSGIVIVATMCAVAGMIALV